MPFDFLNSNKFENLSEIEQYFITSLEEAQSSLDGLRIYHSEIESFILSKNRKIEKSNF